MHEFTVKYDGTDTPMNTNTGKEQGLKPVEHIHKVFGPP
jgi:hypothetical protein